MNCTPRRGKARAPVLFLSSLATLAVVLTLPLLHGPASSAAGEDRQSRAVSPLPTSAPAAASRARAEVHALARLAPEAGIINIGVRPGVRIDRILVKEGDDVAPGTELAILEGRAQADLQVALAEAQKKNAEAQRKNADELRAINREKLALEREHEEKLKHERLTTQESVLAVAKQHLDASKEIYKTLGQAATGKVKYDLDLSYFQAEAEHLKAQLELKELQVSQDLAERRRALERRQLDIPEPDLTVFDRQIELARVGRDQTVVLAPAAGRVLELAAHAGEVSAGTLLAMGDLSAMVAIAEVYQSDVPEVRPGDPAEVLIQGRKVTGKVTRIARLVGRNTLASLDPRALQDRRVVAVTIRLDEPAAAADYVNMEVEVAIKPQNPSQHGESR